MKNYYFVITFCVFASCLLFTSHAIAVIEDSQSTPAVSLRVLALQVNVTEMDTALEFYSGKLGFEVADRSQYPWRVALKTQDQFRLILHKVARLRKMANNNSEIGFTIQVNDLDAAIANMKSKGVPFAETVPRKEALGMRFSSSTRLAGGFL
jgi:catechol 2,3-dioxygenase-like lactoylglutathione lyase family enzyme